MKIIGNLRQAIQDYGSITMAQFMSEAMYNLNEGYYIQHTPIGKDGDFVTSPEISQLFGEMLGIYVVDSWIKLGSPDKFNLVELGPGRATLMEDLLRATKHIENFHQTLNIHFLETNKRLIEIQKQRLDAYNIFCKWHNSIYSLPNDLPIVVLANEFFDCLPINQYVKEKDVWYERSVTLNLEEYNIIKTVIPDSLSNSLNEEHPNSQDLSIVEICYPALEIIQHLAEIFKKTPGYLLAIDYGYDINPLERTAYNYTLQAIKDHKYHPIFNDIGRADLTAHVDFFALKKSALANNCKTYGSVPQGELLKNLGIHIRAEMLKKNASPEVQKDIDSRLNRLIHPKQMGELFKAIAIYSKKLPVPIGFEASSLISNT
ncbi:MAG: SAM-dependent methyltransferase [Rickettsiales bacterium]|jgi:SAM-dependent MidA family methyltransferase|nr:SAM-dependent methyltransferase [Rickettsiales bacterium]